MIVRSGMEIFKGFSPFDVLKDASGLVVDVGAAAGVVTKKMLSYSPLLRCLAIEPFNGNHPYLEKNCGNDLRVKIIKAALSDSNGVKKFKVGATVTGTENGWENYIGYSSGGKLVCDESVGGVVDVEVARLDDIAEQIPFFIKIDVQGGELEVLKGAARLLMKGVPYLYLEYAGQPALLEYIANHNYVMIDTEHLIVPRAIDDFIDDYVIVGMKLLSSGRKAYVGHPLFCERDLVGYEKHFMNQRPGRIGVQTDILCVHDSVFSDFIKLRRQLNKDRNKQKYFLEA